MAGGPDYAGELLAACCGTALHLWRPKIGSDGEDKAVPSDRTVLAAAWNRNNKVVACAREDGSIELRYSNGTLMNTLPRGGPQPGSKPATSLAWSMGSKRLAAASLDGNVYLHDMTAKTCTPLAVDSSAPLKSVVFHPDDRFLATAGRKISLFSVQTLNSLGNLSLDIETPNFTSIAVAASQPNIAAGTACGTVAVWDYKTKENLYIDTSRHIGGTTAVQFAPLDPGVLYSTGKDGALLMQDLRAGPFHIPTARIGTGTGLTTLCIREDFTYLAAGTIDGRVLLYDPRYCAAPAATLRCGDPAPVTSIHWQHNYQSLTSRAKDAVAQAVAEGTLPTGRLSMAMSVQGEEGASSSSSFPAAGAATADRFALDTPADASATAPVHRGRLSVAFSIASHLEPPRKLDLSPIVSLREPRVAPATATATAAAAPATSISDYHAALSRLRRESTATANTVNAPPPPPPPPSQQALPSRPVLAPLTSPVAASQPPNDAGLLKQTKEVADAQVYTTMQNVVPSPLPSPLPPLTRSTTPTTTAVETAAPVASGSTGEPSWRIKAMTPRRGTAAAGNGGDDVNYNNAGVSSRRHYESLTAPIGSPSKVPLVPFEKTATAVATTKTTPPLPSSAEEHLPSHTTTATTQLNLSSPIDGHILQQDILAMHLDMITHFKEQEKAHADLVGKVLAKQEALEDEVASLRQELRDLLSRRDNTLWL